MATRPAGKAGSWYVRDPGELGTELDDYMAEVPKTINGSGLPIPGARMIIAPHAGYTYSGPCAAWAYSSLDLSKAKRVFILGPSHTYYLSGCAVTTFGQYATPFGKLTVDREVIEEIKKAGSMDDIPPRQDSAEHSLEMHLPYLYKRLEQTFGSEDKFPSIVPVLVGSNKPKDEKAIGKIFLPYLKDAENAFIISSDFCHWGSNFDYMVYSPTNDPADLQQLSTRDPAPEGRPIHDTIKMIDEAAMEAVESGSYDKFIDNLKLTQNTVCGRHPIGVAMAALELLAEEVGDVGKAKFKVVRYERSNLVKSPRDFSVSYVSAYAVV